MLHKAFALIASLCTATVSASSGAADKNITVSWKTNVKGVPKGEDTIVIDFVPSLAPIGVAHMKTLLDANFFVEAAFFRVVPNFVVQWGIAGEPVLNSKFQVSIKDDPNLGVSNQPGTISYAMTSNPNSRSTEIFVNLANNSHLDSMNFIVIGHVTKGLDLFSEMYNPTPGNENGVDQTNYTTLGNNWLLKEYPGVNLITAQTYTN